MMQQWLGGGAGFKCLVVKISLALDAKDVQVDQLVDKPAARTHLPLQGLEL
jgi:hypothetical protein